MYCQFRGPHYETPAEVQMAKAIGGHIVGMSTALEAIAARQAGMEILGMSLITNLAAGIQKTPLSHEEVIEAGRAAEPVISEPAREDRRRAVGGTGCRRRTPPTPSVSPSQRPGSRRTPTPRRAPSWRRSSRARGPGDAAASAELADRFDTRLAFGTAGLRGEIAAGPNRMNRVLVAQAAAGLAAYLLERARPGETPSVVIGYDGRKNSAVFARDSAEIMAGAGVRAVLLPQPAADAGARVRGAASRHVAPASW